ncbi:MAG: hypothetical protein HY782_20805 [Chloroflexi bacterium]|nr:hypothetical protein [Chloroflexota bacterium]
MQWKIEYLIFRGDPVWYHLVQVVIHLVISVLLYGLVARVTKKWRVGLVAALLYAPLSLTSMAIYWPSVHDPLAGVFYLLSILLWMDHLESGSRLKGGLAFLAFMGALLTKEVSITLPAMLFLADRIIVKKPASWMVLVKRYIAFIPALAIYAASQWIVISRSEFTGQIGYRLGAQNLYVFVKFLSFLAYPWDADETFRYVWLGGVCLLFLYGCLRRDRRLLFLGAAAVLPVIIVAPIPPHLFNPRYLYLPLMASAVGFGLLLDLVIRVGQRYKWVGIRVAMSLLIMIVGLVGSSTIAEQVTNFGGFIRQIRLQFRPIYQVHPSFAPDTYLYFFDTPLQTLDISGLMFLRYGPNVTVGGVDLNRADELRQHNTAYVYYLGDENEFREQRVEKDVTFQITPVLPAQFQDSIALERVEIASAKIKPGDALVLILYWRADANVGQDYTVFAHLVNSQQQIAASSDSQPRRGLSPTSTWSAGRVQPDGIVIPLDSSVDPGIYSVELGLYDFASMRRLAIVDKNGVSVADKIAVGPIYVGE